LCPTFGVQFSHSAFQPEMPVNKGNLKPETPVQFYEIRWKCSVRNVPEWYNMIP